MKYWIGLNSKSEVRTNYKLPKDSYVESFNVKEYYDKVPLIVITYNLLQPTNFTVNGYPHCVISSPMSGTVEFFGEILDELTMDLLEKMEKL